MTTRYEKATGKKTVGAVRRMVTLDLNNITKEQMLELLGGEWPKLDPERIGGMEFGPLKYGDVSHFVFENGRFVGYGGGAPTPHPSLVIKPAVLPKADIAGRRAYEGIRNILDSHRRHDDKIDKTELNVLWIECDRLNRDYP